MPTCVGRLFTSSGTVDLNVTTLTIDNFYTCTTAYSSAVTREMTAKRKFSESISVVRCNDFVVFTLRDINISMQRATPVVLSGSSYRSNCLDIKTYYTLFLSV